MSLISKLRHHLPCGFSRRRILFSRTDPHVFKPVGITRKFTQPAKQEEEVEATERVRKLVDEISSLTLVEAMSLTNILKNRWGVTDEPVMGVVRAAPGVATEAPTEAKEEKKPEKTTFDVKLESYDAASKIKIIKEVRTFTDLGLKEAKELVEKAPTVCKKGVTKEEAEQIIEKLKAVGAKVVME